VPAPRRLLGALVGSSLLGAVLVGCTSDDPPAPDPTPAASSGTPATEGPARIEVAVYGDALRLRTYQRMADAFNNANPDVVVTLERHEDAIGAVADARLSLQLGIGPDVLLVDQRYLAELVDSGGLEPVDQLLEARGLQFGDDYQRVALTSMSANNRLQCMPVEMSPRVVYLNTKLVPRQQLAAVDVVVPNAVETSWSWLDFVTTARTVAGTDQLGPIKGAYVPSDVGTITAFVRSEDGDIVDDVFDPSSLTLASDSALEAIDELVTLARDPAVSLTEKDIATRDPVDWFTAGELGLFIGTRDHLPALREEEGVRFDVAPLPSMGRGHSISDISGFCLNGASEQTSAAADFMAFAAGAEAAEIMAASGAMVPARLDALAGESFTQPDEDPRNSQVFATSQRRSEPMPYDLAWPEVADLVEDAFGRFFLGVGFDPTEELEARLVRLDEQSETIFDSAD
jgi:multiple sugar transport system substrate-binding protein